MSDRKRRKDEMDEDSNINSWSGADSSDPAKRPKGRTARSPIMIDNDSSRIASFRSSMESSLGHHMYEFLQACYSRVQQWEIPETDPDNSVDPVDRDQIVTYEADIADMSRLSADIENRWGLRGSFVYIWGHNDGNQCGLPAEAAKGGEDDDEDAKQVTIPPTKLAFRNDIRQIAAGGNATFALSTEGKVYSWGANDQGGLGRVTTDTVDKISKQITDAVIHEATPTEITGFVTSDGKCEDGFICQIAAGANHGLALSVNGNVYMWGMYKDCDSGEFSDVEHPSGLPTGYNQFPVHVQIPVKNCRVLDIITGSEACYNAILLDSGDIMTWGMGDKGQMARSADMTDPDPITNEYDLGKRFTGEEYEEVITKDGKKEIEIKFRYKPHIIAEKFLKPGYVRYANDRDWLTQKRVVLSVACGASHLIVAARGEQRGCSRVYVSGLNNYGQLGNENAATEKELQQGKGGNTIVHELTPVKKLDEHDIVKVAAGEFHCMALNIVRTTIFAWGRCDSGQLGIGELKKRQQFVDTPQLVHIPLNVVDNVELPYIFRSISCGGTHSMALTIDDELFIWGSGYVGATGFEGDSDTLVPRNMNEYIATDAKGRKGLIYQASGGTSHSAVLFEDAT